MTDLPPPSPDQPGQPGQPLTRLEAQAALTHQLVANHQQLLDWLASRMAVALPEHVKIERHGLFNMGKVRSVMVILDDVHYDLRVDHGTLRPSTGQVVGGVALNRTELPLEQWVAGLIAGLDKLGQQSTAFRSAVDSLLS